MNVLSFFLLILIQHNKIEINILMYKSLPIRMKQLSSYIPLQLVLPTLKLERHMSESNHLIFQFFFPNFFMDNQIK